MMRYETRVRVRGHGDKARRFPFLWAARAYASLIHWAADGRLCITTIHDLKGKTR